jgi:Asp-tRNA(Asn)/Glu-tRNA(Gln) amidotransferase A subunit family amidase
VYDPSSTLEMVRFTQAANVTGLPALVLPGGRQLAGLPVG